MLLGLGMMARTIPGMFVLPLAVEICHRHGRRWCLMSALLVLMPTVLSLFPLLWQRRVTVLTAGLLSVAGLFALAPTISNQNFYFLMPWAFWATVAECTPAARTFLWVVSLRREGLDYNPFLQIMLHFPVWVALWVWFGRELRLSCTVRRSPLTRPGEEASLT